MKARALVRRRVVLAADAFVEVVVWEIPAPVHPSRHHYKYRLAFVVDGVCVVRYDNERGKGDHRHVGELEEAYAFSTPQQLMQDFEHDVRRWNDERTRTGR